MTSWLPVLALASVLSADPCTLVTRAEAAAILDTPITTAFPSDPEVHPLSNASVVTCMMGGGQVMMLVSVDTYASPEAALKTMTKEFVKELAGDFEARVDTEPPGLGDRAFWLSSVGSARYYVVRGRTTLSITIAGAKLKDVDSKRDAIRALMVKALSRV